MSSKSLRVIVADDDHDVLNSLSAYLGHRGCVVTTVLSSEELESAIATSRPDVVVLDLMAPNEDGLSICRRLANEHPIIILSAISDVADRILGLEMGASDYIAKPFDRRELLARIRSVARRSGGPPRQINKRVLLSEGWTIDLEDRALTDPSGAPVMLSAKEFDLLQTFVERPGRLLSRDYLLSVTHGRDSDVFDRVIDVTISRLRRKLERTARPLIIETVRGEGYRFRPDVRPV